VSSIFYTHISLRFRVHFAFGVSENTAKYGDIVRMISSIPSLSAVFNARGLVCEYVIRARKFTPLARVMLLESKRAKTHLTHVSRNTARCKHARAIGFGEGRGPTRPLGTHNVDGGVRNAWVWACANHTRPTRGTRREHGSKFSRTE
jgi:hypothetical protein